MTQPDERKGAPPPGGDPFGGGQRGGREKNGGAADNGGRIALLLGLSGAVLSVLFFPLGLVLDIAAIAVGTRALRRARGRGTTARGAVPGVVFGSIGAVLVVVVVTLLALFWQEVRTYQECMSGANTIRSEEKCTAEFEHALRERFGIVD